MIIIVVGIEFAHGSMRMVTHPSAWDCCEKDRCAFYNAHTCN